MGASEAKRKKQNKKMKMKQRISSAMYSMGSKNVTVKILFIILDLKSIIQILNSWEYMMVTEQKEKKHLSL